MRGELELKDNAIANLETQISGVVAGNNDQVSTIAELETKLSGVMAELLEREQAIANLKTELEARGEDKQLNLFPGQEPPPIPTQIPSPEPTPTPTPEIVNPESTPQPVKATPVTVTVETPGLVEYINLIAPGSGITTKVIGNAITRHLKGAGESGKGRNLCSLESDYKFKYLGKSDNKHKFSIPKL